MTAASVSRTLPLMGTMVTIEVLNREERDTRDHASERDGAIARAFRWFDEVESACSRFDPSSELRQLCAPATIGRAVPVSDLLYSTIEFAITVARDSEGAFDPTVGRELEARGFTRNYRDGEVTPTLIGSGAQVSFRDVQLDPEAHTVTLTRPLVLDLGAVAKGLAVDLAAREMNSFTDFAIDAGGDLYLGGSNARAEPWSVGIRHPRLEGQTIATVRVSDMAVCTSGDYERLQADGAGHHIVDPRTGAVATGVASVTVVAHSAMLADALATAAFVLGPIAGLRWIEAHGVQGLIVSPSLERFATMGMRDDAILPHT